MSESIIGGPERKKGGGAMPTITYCQNPICRPASDIGKVLTWGGGVLCLIGRQKGTLATRERRKKRGQEVGGVGRAGHSRRAGAENRGGKKGE